MHGTAPWPAPWSPSSASAPATPRWEAGERRPDARERVEALQTLHGSLASSGFWKGGRPSCSFFCPGRSFRGLWEGLTKVQRCGMRTPPRCREGLIGNPVRIRSRPAAVTGDESPKKPLGAELLGRRGE